MQTGESLTEITVYPAGTQTGGFVCRDCRLIREVPGTRRIYSAVWQGQTVILKVFSRFLSAKRHTLREWKALQKLRNLQILHPEPLFYGKTAPHEWALATEFIPNASDTFTLFHQLGDIGKRRDLLLSVIGQLAHLHILGVYQHDLHLGNFLQANQRLYVLDPAQMRFSDQPVPIQKSLRQLALLCSNWPADGEEQMELFIRKYFAVRGLTLRPWQTDGMLRQIRNERNRINRKSLQKTLRTSKRYSAIKTKMARGIFVRNWLDSKTMSDLPSQIDLLMSRGKILKRGNTCFVAQVELGNRPVVIKRYNHKGFIHSLRQSLRGSRAKRCWQYGHLLNWLCIPTPEPLAYIEKRIGPLVYCSYIINAYIEGPKLDDFLNDVSIPEEKQSEIITKAESILTQMDLYRITHGDLKRANILITESGPVLIDLDSLMVHRFGLLYRHYRNKDLRSIEAT